MEYIGVGLLILSATSGALLAIKAVQKKDSSIIGSISARIYIAYISLSVIITGEVNYNDLWLGISILFIAEIISNILFQVDKQHTDQRNLAQKFKDTIDNSILPFFTIDLEGRLEYINRAFENTFRVNRLEARGKRLSDILGIDCDFPYNLTNDSMECIILHNGERRNAILIGSTTKNGHETITGSIYLK